jgi:hypothetical protein
VKRPLVFAIAALVVLAGAGAVSQVILPSHTASRIEDRLTTGGGSAAVSIDATPAARLLVGDGDRITVRGTGLNLDLAEDPEVFERLDGFDDVEVRLDDFRAGPFEVASFDLTRSGSAPYRVVSTSATTGRDLLAYGTSRLGLPGGPLLGYVTGRLPDANRPIPIELDMELDSEDGRVVVVSGGGTVAGLPTGPLAQLITEAIVVRL